MEFEQKCLVWVKIDRLDKLDDLPNPVPRVYGLT